SSVYYMDLDHDETKSILVIVLLFFFQAEDGIRDRNVTGVQTCALPISTGLLAHVLEESMPISYLIGDGTGKGHQDSEYFVFEACEYKRHFLSYCPDYAIMTNIDFDHPDYFKDVDDVFDAFQEMADQ